MTREREALRYIRRMDRIERGLVADIRRLLREARRDMLDIFERLGLDGRLGDELYQIARSLERDVVRIWRKRGPDIDAATLKHLEKQLRIVKRAIGSVPDATRLHELTALERSEKFSELTSTPAWVGALALNLRQATAQMRASGEEEAAAMARLFALDIRDGRASVLRHAANSAQVETSRTLWSIGSGFIGAYYLAVEQETGDKLMKQAIAAIDERTTDCCLRVHGQIQPQDEPFHLTGTPRFADYVMEPPFHWNCRTATVIYHPAMEEFDTSTEQMREAARDELIARKETGERVEIHPAHATSRR